MDPHLQRSNHQQVRLWRYATGTDLRRLVTGGLTAAVVVVIAAIAVDATHLPGNLWAWQCAFAALGLAASTAVLLWTLRAPAIPRPANPRTVRDPAQKVARPN